MASVTSITETAKGRRNLSDPPRINVVSFILVVICVGVGVGLSVLLNHPVPVIVAIVLGLISAASPKVAQQWERAVVLRLGKYTGLHGPGLFPHEDEVETKIAVERGRKRSAAPSRWRWRRAAATISACASSTSSTMN